jgi:peptidoglycan/xylan/chitin deacetylase (PgdA/CDA1 family)
LHGALGIPATLFAVGRTLERWPEAFREIASDPLFDLQQHTYSHQLLKTVCIDDGMSVRVVQGVGLEEIREEVSRTSELLRQIVGIECLGLTGPWCYYRGLRDRPDILAILHDEGIRFTRTDGRNEHDWHPVSMDLQPYWYEALGFPDMLEIPIHAWHDCVIRDEILGWDDLDGYVDSVKPYIDQAATEDKVFSLCQHDWSSIRADPEMRATREILRYALEVGLRPMTYRDFYLEQVAQRSGTASNPAMKAANAA